MKVKTELLSPAGSIESFYAAVNSGANAIYVGGKNFSARYFSQNFDDEELMQAIKYAHNKNVKVYVAINTLLKDTEIKKALNYAFFLYNADVDGVIIQDLGLLFLISTFLPNLKTNISTQASIYDIHGVNFFDLSSVDKYILARELSLENIKKITNNTDKNIETFVHGALCMSYSGQCLFSSFLGGRSGNRGKCAQPCRLNYSFVDENGAVESNNFSEKPLLSLKDFKVGVNIFNLIDAGVSTFKIEGRMKDSEYVAIVTEYYRNLIDSYLVNNRVDVDGLSEKVQKVFSRGFTNGYIKKSRETMFAGVSSGSKSNSSKDVSENLKDRLSPFYENTKSIVNFSIDIKLGEKIRLVGSDDKNTACFDSDEIVDISINNPITEKMIIEQLSKFGNSIFKLGEINVNCADNAFVKKSTLNKLRRDVLDELYEKRSIFHNREKVEILSDREVFSVFDKNSEKKASIPKISLKINSTDDLNYVDDKIDRLYVPVTLYKEDLTYAKDKEKFIYLNNIVSESTYEILLKNKEFIENNFNGVCVNNVGSFDFFSKNFNLDIHCGNLFNIINSFSAKFIEEKGSSGFTFSQEVNIRDIESICKNTKLTTEVTAYAFTQLMAMKNCPFSELKKCNNQINCDGCKYKTKYKLKDRLGIKFNIKREDGTSFMYNSVPLSIIGKTNEFLKYDIDYYMIDSIWSAEVKTAIDALYFEIRNCENSSNSKDVKIITGENKFTRGHFFKSVL